MKSVLFLMMMVPGLMLAQDNISAEQIMRKADEKARGMESSISEMKITTVRPRWSREMTLKSWAKGEDLSLILIKSPARDKGTVFLKRNKEIWNWVPSIERTIKMPPSMMMQSWMGTDLTNDDLVRESSVVNDYTHRVLNDSVIENRKCWKLQLIPKEDAPVVWGKIYVWVDQTDFMQLRTEFYDEDGYLINVMQASDIKILGGKLLPAKLEVIPMEKKGQKTVMEYVSIQFDTKLEESFFTIQNMKKLR